MNPNAPTYGETSRDGNTEVFIAEVRAGLHASPRYLPAKLLYDRRGSELFDEITRLPEYYLTRTELEIMQEHGNAIARALGPSCLVIEPGSGASTKTRLLLDRLDHPAGYIPIDISQAYLAAAVRQLADAYPELEILPVCADYTCSFVLPQPRASSARRLVYFPGSTIGNFEPGDAQAFLQHMRQLAGPGSGLLIGIDLKKDPKVLHAAYNDAAGVTAAFNRNVLHRINREANGDFDPDQFAHYAFYHPIAGRVEMHLVSLREQVVSACGERFTFDVGQTIVTEHSYKYTAGEFQQLARRSGYLPADEWTDPRQRATVQLFWADDG